MASANPHATTPPTQDARVRLAASHWGPRFVANGVDLSDFNTTLTRISTWEQWCAEWSRTALRYEELAQAAERSGRALAAAEAWRRAALCWHFGKFVFMEDPDLARHAQDRLVACYAKGMSALEPPAQRVEIPYEDIRMPGLLRRPEDITRPPVVLMLPGLDSVKEELQTTADYFLRRGLATLAIDGPGQGETEHLRNIEPAYERPAAAALEWIRQRRELDGERIGVFGVSLGGYYAVRTAAYVPGVRAAVDLAGLYSLSEGWDQRPPMTRATFTKRSGAGSEEEARERAALVTLEGTTHRVQCPLLIVHGTMDTIAPFADAERIRAEVSGAELAAFEGSNHGCTDRVFESRALIADWMAEHLRQA